MVASGALEGAIRRLGEDRRDSLERLVGYSPIDLEWYLDEKIVRPADYNEVLNHVRALKYALLFSKTGARTTFVRESRDKSPDLMIEVDGLRFFVEVKKFNAQYPTSNYPVSKIADAVAGARDQLPLGEMGIVAIDNFDILGIESREGHGFSHEHILEGLSEIEWRASNAPSNWRRPSGVILAASTSDGAGYDPFPHFLWFSEYSDEVIPAQLQIWLRSSLPNGEIWDQSHGG